MVKIKRSIIIGFIVLYSVLMSGQMENLVSLLNKGKMYSWGMDFVNVVRKYEITLYVIIIFSSFFLRNVNSIEKNREKFKIKNLKKYILSVIISLTLIIGFGIAVTKLLYYFKLSGDSYSKTDFFAFQYSYLNYVFMSIVLSYQYKYCKNIYIVGFTHHCVNIVGMGINMFLLN